MAHMACWEEDSEAGLNRHDLRFSRINNVHIQIEPNFILCDILQAISKDCGQSLDKTVPPKFHTHKFAAMYLEAHIDLDKFYARIGASPPKNAMMTKSNKRTWSANAGASRGSILK
ncbi:hypothetical protein C8R45DRAFT_947993 [Mycena sanguinolenta]|nr:hypothetical protein C8R45DRAFT_947993 [Mycena sanguinolenta]